MLAETDEVRTHLVREHRLLDDVANDLRVRPRLALGIPGDVAERVEPELYLR